MSHDPAEPKHQSAPTFTAHELALIEGLARLELAFLASLESRGFSSDSNHIAKLGILAAKSRLMIQPPKETVTP